MPGWVAIVNLHHLIDNSTSLSYGPLFGLHAYVKEPWAFTPLADNRGLPDDVSEDMRRTVQDAQADDPGGGVLSPSWLTWSELKGIDWEEESTERYPICYQRLPDESERRVGLASRPGEAEPALLAAFANPEAQVIGQQWETPEGTIYRIEHPRRRDTVSQNWWLAFALMEQLATQFGDDGVRAVVFFSF